MNNDRPTMYALLVGIDAYRNPSVPDLRGCVNDVDAVEQLLHSKFAIPADHIRKLTDAEATHEAIKTAFREHLIGNARTWADAGREGSPPAFIFHYSGHGSQARDETGTEPDGMDETIVPHDSRTAGVYDIKDWELGQMIDELTRYSDNVTIVLDCCHSGSGTRVIKESTVRTRRCDPDLRPQPTQRPDVAPGARTRSVTTPSGWELGERYVLLAGCRDRELSHEYAARQGDGYRQHGAMTYFLVRELSQASPDRAFTYRELHDRIRYQVNSLFEEQTPQCEGDRDRLVFGGVRPAHDTFLTVVDKSEGFIWVDGGLAHGLTEDSQLHVYPPETRTLDDAGEPLATLSVVEVGSVRSGCIVEDGQADVPLHARAVVYRLNYGDMQRTVVLDVDDTATRAALEERLTQQNVAPYVTLVTNDRPAEFRIELIDDRLELQDSAGVPLVASFAPDQLDALADDLSHLVRYRNALTLRNTADYSELAGAVELAVKALTFDPETQEPIAEPIEPTAGGELVLDVGQEVVIEVTNRADVPLYFAIFAFNHDWSVVQLYPRMRGAHEPLASGATHSLGLSRRRRERLAATLPDEVPEARQIVKVIATVEDADFEILEQKALKLPHDTRKAPRMDTPLSRLMAQAVSGGDRRNLGPPPASAEDEWTTEQVEFRLVHPADGDAVSRSLQGGTTTRLPAFDLEVEAPAGFSGQVRVLTEQQSTRAIGDTTDLQPPPGLAAYADRFRPVPVPSRGTRSTVGPAGAVIELDADDVSRNQITAATPLKLRVPPEVTAGTDATFVLAYDGSFYFPVGRPGDAVGTLDVEWLPPSAPADEEPLRSTRSLGRTVKLYLFKTVGWEEPSLGLHHARFVPADRLADVPAEPDERRRRLESGGEVRYRPLRDVDLAPGRRAALFVHGFSSESHWMVRGPAEWLKDNGVTYDCILTFDYETFNTRITDNGKLLANALREAGFGPDDDVHLDVFGHSMGTLVARSMVEQWGGDAFVDRCFLAGPPNEGSPLAEAQRLIPWVGTMLLNKAGPTPPTIVASWALKRIADDAVGIQDLRPGSDFLTELNRGDGEAGVRYHVLAGRNEIPADARDEWDRFRLKMEQGIDAALDFIYKDQNDLVITVASMRSVRGGTYPETLLHTALVPCDHFEYFGARDARSQLLNWAQSQE